MPPAARVTDMHVCPMVTGIVPHVGGPILPAVRRHRHHPDAFKDTIRVEIGPSVFEKTLVESGRDELPAAKQARNQVAQLLIDRGEHTLHSKPK